MPHNSFRRFLHERKTPSLLENRAAQSVSMSSPTLQGRIATEDEIRDLQHVPAHLPKRVWLAATIGMAERFAYYGTQTLFRQYTTLNYL